MLCNKWDAAFITDDKSAQGTVSAFAEAAEITDVDPLLLKFVNVRSSWMIAIWRHKSKTRSLTDDACERKHKARNQR